MFYVGNTFDEKANKGYKTIQNAKKAAENDGLSVWDEEGVKLYPLKVEVTDDVPDDAALEEKPDGCNVSCQNDGVRPVLHLNLAFSDVYSYAGTVCSDGTEEEVELQQ